MKLEGRSVISSLALAVGLSIADAQAQEAARAGKPHYERRCAQCHGTNGAPQPNIAKMLMAEIPHLGSPEVQALSTAQLQKIVKEGSGKMKAVKGIASADLVSIIDYIRTFSKP